MSVNATKPVKAPKAVTVVDATVEAKQPITEAVKVKKEPIVIPMPKYDNKSPWAFAIPIKDQEPVTNLGTLKVDGIEQTPTLEKVTVKDFEPSKDHTPILTLSWDIKRSLNEHVFNVFEVKIGDGQTTFYLVTLDSEVEITPTNITLPGISVFSNKNKLVVVNSKSINDTVIGESILENVSTENCIINQSIIINNDKHQNKRTLSFHNVYRARRIYKDVQLKKTQVYNTELSKGQYIKSSFNGSFVSGNGLSRVSESELFETSVSGAEIYLKKAMLYDTTVYGGTTKPVTITSSRFSDTKINGGEIYLTSQFDYLSITSINGSVEFIRSSASGFDIGLGYYNLKNFSIDSDRETIETHVRGLVSLGEIVGFVQDPKPTVKELDPITQSLVTYITDAIVSRLKVIKVLQAAKGLDSFFGNYRYEYEDIFAF